MPPLKFNHPHYDASENIFLRRALEHVRSKTYDIQFPEYKGRRFLPIDNEVHPGAEVVSFDTYSQVGRAEITADYANDGPAVDTFATSEEMKIFGMTNHYSYNLQEVRAGMMAGGRSLPDRKASVARRGIEQTIDEILLLGNSTYGMKGLFTLTGTITYTVPAGDSASQAFEDKTSDEILADLNGIVSQVVSDTKGVEVPNTLILPLTSYQYIRDTRMGDGIGDTILQYFLKNNPHIQSVENSHYLESNAGWTGKRMVAYNRSADKLQGVIPQEFEQLPPESRGMRTVTICHARCGGVQLYYPKSVAYGDGI